MLEKISQKLIGYRVKAARELLRVVSKVALDRVLTGTSNSWAAQHVSCLAMLIKLWAAAKTSVKFRLTAVRGVRDHARNAKANVRTFAWRGIVVITIVEA